MKKSYLVTLVRTVSSVAVIEVVAENKDDAETKAFDEAACECHPINWEESDFSISVYGVEEQPDERE
jgi:hypothetical protein